MEREEKRSEEVGREEKGREGLEMREDRVLLLFPKVTTLTIGLMFQLGLEL